MGRYDAKIRYSKPDTANRYDYNRFTSAGGKAFDAIEKGVILSILAPATKGMTALDAGTGTGRFAMLLAKAGLNTVGCDASMPMLYKARENLLNQKLDVTVTLVNGDIYHLPLKDNSFDYVVCVRVLNQLGSKQYVRDALKELCRVCNSNGTIIFDFVNSHSLARLATLSYPGLIAPSEVKTILYDIQGVHIKAVEGRLILSQTLLEKAPRCLLKVLVKADSVLSRCLPEYATRMYFVLTKI